MSRAGGVGGGPGGLPQVVDGFGDGAWPSQCAKVRRYAIFPEEGTGRTGNADHLAEVIDCHGMAAREAKVHRLPVLPDESIVGPSAQRRKAVTCDEACVVDRQRYTFWGAKIGQHAVLPEEGITKRRAHYLPV